MTRILALFLAVSLTVAPASAVWPLPQSFQTGSSALRLSPRFDIQLSVNHASQDLRDAVSRTKFHLKNDKLGRLVVGRGSSDEQAVASAPTLALLTLSLTGPGSESIATEAQKLLGERDEAYALSIPSDGSTATITANSTLGLYRGLTTFEQLWYHYNGHTYTIQAPIEVEDFPAYPYRGLMLDTARNYFPVDDIKRTLDAMSMVKINTFHWHVVDSQSFPLQIPGFENISAAGAYASSSVYSAANVRDIVSYAGARGIDVIMEIDTPGHTSVISKAYPEHIACPESTPWATYANEPPAGQLRFVQPETAEFAANLLGAAAALTSSAYFNTGGDELNTACYEQDEPTTAILNQTGLTLYDALDNFTATTHKRLIDSGKTPIVWEEMVLNYNVTSLSNETLVLVWISSNNVAAVAQKGYKLIHAASDYFYLDCGAGAWVGDFPQGNSWCDPFKSWQKSYTFDPVSGLTETEKTLVQGGQHLLWTEQSGPENLDSIVWPRAASSAELFWSGPGGNVSAALPRLHNVAYRMRTRGVKAISLQPEWCAIRPGVCDLTA
ncbi:N-acetylhexosaminidase [Vararia minispora EC-137]|uniref:N-acetylhexosaminidase n=1 Tax=Vararia minispora EC-137 TaxID=1314806 RepID=A0ACB8Q8B6_9AGAM|nr:N-acetylhexosaminidase [Vararia minispora EC-137]